MRENIVSISTISSNKLKLGKLFNKKIRISLKISAETKSIDL
ncbi:MAG: hypothetical protein QXK37_02800 [Candidatus Woesearchaeota archaeon]